MKRERTGYVRVRDKAINDGGQSASNRQSVTGITSNGGANPRRHYHHGGVLSLALHHSQTPHNTDYYLLIYLKQQKSRSEKEIETLKV